MYIRTYRQTDIQTYMYKYIHTLTHTRVSQSLAATVFFLRLHYGNNWVSHTF